MQIGNDEICFISACRDSYSNNEKQKRTKELEADVRALGYGFIQVVGAYTENRGTEQEKEVKESSLLVINPSGNAYNPDFAQEMLYLCGKYGQECILLKTADFPSAFYNTDGKRISGILSKLSTHDFEDAFTRIHGQRFTLIETSERLSNEIKSHRSMSEHVAGVWLRKAMARNIYNWEDVD